ncbi:MAG: CAP domain-containing protein [Lutibacter sp.]|uniref:CAP domain-containing protein n=1 Tax=Lutibacter sp. TaxID=1925666 RepID=UPI0017C9416C|nr:CAP domain-containing protein [Lutibacter sp.]MBT8317331.1 CAP domain-containing protein [Lutibacter sp.]NNJ58190.1 CAP domain-containing protein [Lutibacter sp.]
MKSLKIKLILFALVCTVFNSCSSGDEGIYFNEFKTEYATMELEIIDLINEYRISLGMLPFETLDIISSVALTQSSHTIINDEMNHDVFIEQQENSVALTNAKWTGESLAYGFSSATSVINAMLNNENHKAIIENDSYTHIGISIEQNRQGRNYFTKIFIKK